MNPKRLPSDLLSRRPNSRLARAPYVDSPIREPLPIPKPGQDPAFDEWKSRNAPRDSGYDYDLYAMFKDLDGADPVTDSRGHGTDTYKRPNHPTFSTGSRYADARRVGGVWSKDASGKDVFTPSRWMAQDKARMQELPEYMRQAEPDTTLAPAPSADYRPPQGPSFGELAKKILARGSTGAKLLRR